MQLMSGSWEGRSCAKSMSVLPGSGNEVGAGIGRAISFSFFAAFNLINICIHELATSTHMLNLGNAHCWFTAVGFDKLIWVVECPSHLDDHLYPSIPRQLHNLLISLARIGVRILLEHQMGDSP